MKKTAAISRLVEGRVIAHLGKSLAVEAADGVVIHCQTRRRLGVAAVGDNVLWEPSGKGEGRVAELLPRRSVLLRPAYKGGTRPVAANLDQIMVVFSVEPKCDFLLIDQYLVVCECHSINALLVFNKCDLAICDELIESQLAIYRALDYPVVRVSAKSGEGMSTLHSLLQGHTSMLAGQSGVGKSSLTNALLPDKNILTAALSAGSGHGRHTTTTATLYHLPDGGDLIDSPGVAIFGLAGISEHGLANGFKEFQPLIEQCRFNDCRHIDDKGCAVRDAVEQGVVSAQRYQRYLKLREKLLRN